VAAAKQCLQASTIAFYLLGHFYASYRQLTISTNNSLPPTRLPCFPPAYAPLFAAMALPTTHDLCMFAANEKSKKDMTLQSTIVSRKAGGCMAF
jgi:hypothetical protein